MGLYTFCVMNIFQKIIPFLGLYTYCVMNIFEKSSTRKKKKKKISNPKMFEKLIEKGV